MNLQRRLLGFLGLLAVVLGLVYVSWPVGHIPPYDANLVRLAESDLQAYCAGATIMKTGGPPDANLAAECRAKGGHPDKPDLRVVLGAFCRGVLDAGFDGTQDDCLAIMSENEYWPTYDGSVSNQWNRARPYPATLVPLAPGSPQGSSRTGGHGGATRPTAPTRSPYGGSDYGYPYP